MVWWKWCFGFIIRITWLHLAKWSDGSVTLITSRFLCECTYVLRRISKHQGTRPRKLQHRWCFPMHTAVLLWWRKSEEQKRIFSPLEYPINSFPRRTCTCESLPSLAGVARLSLSVWRFTFLQYKYVHFSGCDNLTPHFWICPFKRVWRLMRRACLSQVN